MPKDAQRGRKRKRNRRKEIKKRKMNRWNRTISYAGLRIKGRMYVFFLRNNAISTTKTQSKKHREPAKNIDEMIG